MNTIPANIKEMVNKAIQMLKDINIPITNSLNPTIEVVNASSFWGMCHSDGRGYAYRIRLAKMLLAQPENIIMETILHELIHTCPGCMNHGRQWKEYVRKCNAIYNTNINANPYKYDAKRAAEVVNMEPVKVAHRVQCTCCGRTWDRARNSNLTLHPERYHCQCGVSFGMGMPKEN